MPQTEKEPTESQSTTVSELPTRGSTESKVLEEHIQEGDNGMLSSYRAPMLEADTELRKSRMAASSSVATRKVMFFQVNYI
ncbi:unnamed protein product [Enterobius vermicularis]|uniref:Uncharacterized protein n=1 Tax=Enterobius vermicularis TaxID=51028 RepID=A0A0N4UV69_ENTVE|nr:unnamed protein product [Enterobius vermicularis]